jgi:hypothetical protein
MSPHQCRTAEIAERMWQVIIRPEEARCKPGPEQEWAQGNDGPNRDDINQALGESRRFEKIETYCGS